MKSVLSRIVVTGAAITAAAGWIGAPADLLTPTDQAQAAVIQVRDRAAWQPSPVPTQYQQPAAQPAAQTAPAVPAPVQPAAAVAVAPAPVLTAPPAPSLLTSFTQWLTGLFGKGSTVADPAAQIEAIPGSGSTAFIPM